MSGTKLAQNGPINYYAKLAPVVGGITATILLQQIVYWHGKMGKHYYKYRAPCDKSKPGQSWCEELGFTPGEFDGARKKIATKLDKEKGVTIETVFDLSQMPEIFDHLTIEKYLKNGREAGLMKKLVAYWTTQDRQTYYAFNQPLFDLLFDMAYAEISPTQDSPIRKKWNLQIRNFAIGKDTETTTEITKEKDSSPPKNGDDTAPNFPQLIQGAIYTCVKCKTNIFGADGWVFEDGSVICPECGKSPPEDIPDYNAFRDQDDDTPGYKCHECERTLNGGYHFDPAHPDVKLCDSCFFKVRYEDAPGSNVVIVDRELTFEEAADALHGIKRSEPEHSPEAINGLCEVEEQLTAAQVKSMFAAMDEGAAIRASQEAEADVIKVPPKQRTVKEKKPKKSPEEKQTDDNMWEAVKHVWKLTDDAAWKITKLRKFLLGNVNGTKADKRYGDVWKLCQLNEQPATPREVVAFGSWYRQTYPDATIPEKGTTLLNHFQGFRGHVEYKKFMGSADSIIRDRIPKFKSPGIDLEREQANMPDDDGGEITEEQKAEARALLAMCEAKFTGRSKGGVK